MIKIAVVDDEITFQNTLINYLEEYQNEHHITLDVSSFSHGLEITESKEKFDIVFMDIEMPVMDGLQASKSLREKDQDFILFLVTNFGNLAIKGYEVNALDFIVKPISYFEFSVKFERALRLLAKKQKDQHIVMNDTSGSSHVISVRDIVYIEVNGHHVSIHKVNETLVTYGTLKAVIKMLDPTLFFQINKYYVINLSYVEKIDTVSSTVFLNGTSLMMSRGKRKPLMDAIIAFTERERE